MKKSIPFLSAYILSASIVLSVSGCLKKDEPVNYERGTFPETIQSLTDLNSPYDDYNTTFCQIEGYLPLLFSSNRGSTGGQFDLVQGIMYFTFNKMTGAFNLVSGLTNDTFLASLITRINTGRDDLGPYRIYSPLDGYEYLIVSSVNSEGNLDFFYTKNRPYFGYDAPLIEGPFSVNIFNSGADEAYFCFNARQDSAYLSSNSEGDFDIYVHAKSNEVFIDTWLNSPYSQPQKVDSINSTSDDKCPYIFNKIMVFASDRPGGFGGYDLYYSLLKAGKWSSPVNLGPDINSEADEYRPVIGGFDEFTNYFMIFSSNRTGGQGGFDLYFTGFSIPEL